LWLYRDESVAVAIDKLYEEVDQYERRSLWRWLLSWTTPTASRVYMSQDRKD
jgi:hypothetical protein